MTACYLPCGNGEVCPDGMECVIGDGVRRACVTRDYGWYEAAAKLAANAGVAAEPGVLAREPLPLDRDFVVDGELDGDDPVHALAFYFPSAANHCTTGGDPRPYDAYAFDLIGPGPHRILADVCSMSDFRSAISVYQAPGSDSPFDLADPCKNLVAGEAANSRFCEQDSAFVPVDGLAEGRVVVVLTVAGADPAGGGYTLRVSSDTSYPGTLPP